jgi:DegV family protein with EDD domain
MQAGSAAAWTAMSKPVAGTLPTVLEDFSEELGEQVATGVRDIRVLLQRGLERAQESLANTPAQLAVLRQAGVVDAGGQGFVDLLEGIWTYVESGATDTKPVDWANEHIMPVSDFELGKHRYCTECVLEGSDLDQQLVMARLEKLDSSSLIVAGGHKRVRVHIHVNNPAEVFLACEDFGAITQQKADDMKRQHGMMNLGGETAVVVDSGGDLPASEVDRLGIHVVPVRLSFGDQEYIDGVSLKSKEFYRLLAESEQPPLTSQPPPQDFSRVFSLLTSHGYAVVYVGLSGKLSGTLSAARQAASRSDSAARQAASRSDGGDIRVIDSLSATAGLGLLAIVAAEAASVGMSADEVEALVLEMVPRTRVVGIADDLSYGVRGGRVPAFSKRIADWLHFNPVLTASKQGTIKLGGLLRGRGARPGALARNAVRKMNPDTMYRVLIAHMDNESGAKKTRHHILEGHGRIHSCHITEAGPALGVHLGPGGLVVGFLPQPDVLS